MVPTVEPGLVRCASSMVRVCTLADAVWPGELAVECNLGQPEIKNLGVPALGDEDVGRLNVAMNDSLRVRGVEGIGDFNREPQQDIGLDGFSRNPVLEGDALKKLHGDEGLAVFLANVVDGADTGMVECRGRLGLTPKSFQRLPILGNVFGQEFQGDEAFEASVLGFKHHPHTAAAELLDDAVMRNRLTYHRRKSYVCETGKSTKAAELHSVGFTASHSPP